MLSGYKIIIEQDTNPSSLSYGQTRQRRVFSEETCPPGTDVAQWEMTNQYCEMVDRMRNGYLVTIYTDVNEDSATYNQTRTERVMDATTCPIDTTNPNWQNTGEAYCEQILYTPGNVYGNSGYEIQIQTDVNEFSSTYNQTRSQRTQNLTNCPRPSTNEVWEIISTVCETEKKNNALIYTGYKIVTRINTNQYSSTYTGVAETLRVLDTTACPISDTTPNWITQSSYCEVSNGANTGYLIIIQKDTNPLSDTYGQTQQVKVLDTVTCPQSVQPSTHIPLDFEIANNIRSDIYGGRIRLNNGDIDIEFDNTIAKGASMIGTIQVNSSFENTPLVMSSFSFMVDSQITYTAVQTPNPFVWKTSTGSLRFDVNPA